jgi:hypothetical protein
VEAANQNQFCKFGDIPYGACFLVSALGESRIGIKAKIAQDRPYPAVVIFKHPRLNGMPGILTTGADTPVLHVSNALFELPAGASDVSFLYDDETLGTILQSAESLLLVTCFDQWRRIYVDVKTGQTQFTAGSQFVAFKSWKIVQPTSSEKTTLLSFPQ